MLGLDIPLSSLDAIQQPLGGADLLLVTQDTPNGLRSYRGTLAQLMEWIFVGSGTVDDYIPHDYLDMVRTNEPNSGLLGNGKITDPMALNYDYLLTVFASTSAFSDYQDTTNAELANQANLIDDLGTYLENNFVKNSTFNDHAAAEASARDDGDAASRTYTDNKDLARAIDTLNKINLEAYSRDQAINTEANNRADGDSVLQTNLNAETANRVNIINNQQVQIDALVSVCNSLQAQINAFTSSNWTAQQIVNLVYPVNTAIVTNTSGGGAPQQPANQLQAYPYATWTGVGRTYDMDPWVMKRTS